MKKILLGWWWIAALLLGITSCSDEDDSVAVLPPVGEEEVLFTEQSDVTVVNTKDIVLGESEDDLVFEMTSTILTTSGSQVQTTLNCCAMGAAPLTTNPENGMTKVDPDREVTHVTLVNRGTITVHTRALVERYKDLVNTLDDTTRPYVYLRLLVMYAGANSTVINEGKINIYFDHDPSSTSTIYVMGMCGGDNSSLINNGEINFYGNGSIATRLRGMATFGDEISCFNKGTMTADVEICEDSRLITTGGTRSNVINDGIMKMRVPGMALCMTRYKDTNLINNNLVDLTLVDLPEGYTPVGNGVYPTICALYEPLSGDRQQMPSMVNRGTINVRIEGTERTNPVSQAYGIFCDLMNNKGEQLEVNIINDGNINLAQSGPVRCWMAEAGFIAKPAAAKAACNIKLGRWRTTLRDFSQTHDLFLARGAKMDFSGGEIMLARGEDYVDGTCYSVAPEDLFYDAGNGTYRYEYTGYEGLAFSADDGENDVIQWDSENRTAALDSK